MRNRPAPKPTLLFLTVLALVLPGSALSQDSKPAAAPEEPSHEDAGARIVGSALVDGAAWDKLSWLTDRIGARLSGTRNLERAVEWAGAQFRRDGLEQVWTEEVMVPRWVRGTETARIVAPVESDMALLALGGSVPTPTGGITAELLVVRDFDELEAQGEAVDGKIVLYNRRMEPGFGGDHGYGALAKFRVHGASRAARLGAVGMLVRSLGTADYRLPHTGSLHYEEGVARIPAAAIAAEDAMLLARLADSGETVRVFLDLGCKTLPDVLSHNVLAEIRGRELPEEIVLIGAHLDSWDVGTGAHDDGSGVVAVIETMAILHRLGLTPRRTLRAVLFTNEENGLRGGKDYAERHREEMPKHVAAIESDLGGAHPYAYGVTAGEGSIPMVQAIADRLAFMGADRVLPWGGGADISPMKQYGVPQLGQYPDPERYFEWHHTEADTLDKVDRHDLNRNVAALALIGYMLAEQEATLPRLTVETEED